MYLSDGKCLQFNFFCDSIQTLYSVAITTIQMLRWDGIIRKISAEIPCKCKAVIYSSPLWKDVGRILQRYSISLNNSWWHLSCVPGYKTHHLWKHVQVSNFQIFKFIKLLSIEFHSITLGGYGYGMVKKNCAQKSARVTFCLSKTGPCTIISCQVPPKLTGEVLF